MKGAEQKVFPTKKACCNYFGINIKTLDWLIDDGFAYQGWYFDYLCEPERKTFTLPRE